MGLGLGTREDTFTELAEGFANEVVCEVDGHGESTGLGVIHVDGPVEWKEFFKCAKCGRPFELLVCDGVHRFMLAKIIEKNPTEVTDCEECGDKASLVEVYVRSARWG